MSAPLVQKLDEYLKMSARPEAVEALNKSTVSYEDLAEIEKQFDDAETEISEFTLWMKWLHKELLRSASQQTHSLLSCKNKC